MKTTRVGGSQLVLALLLGASCGDSAEVPICDTGDGEVVRGLALNPRSDRAKSDGSGNMVVPIEVTAHVPCLRGGLHVNLRTSVGALGSSKPGDPPQSLFLGPMGTEVLSAQVSGEALLTLPAGRTARVDAEIGETTAAVTVGPL